MDTTSPSVSFIGIVDFTEDARWLYCSESVHDLLGFEPHELIGTPSLDLVHPDEFPQVRAIHYSTITQDQAAVLVYLRLRHKDPCKGYVLCAISRTVAQNVLVGSVSFASPGPKAMHNASTAQEVTIITPTAKDFEFRRWGDPNPMPPCAVPASLIPPDAPPTIAPMHFDPLPEQSIRSALILDRFSMHCRVLYCSNDSILSTTHVLSRSFFDFVAKRDEELVRSWIDVIKGWGVNERGQPSDGGFGFGKFALLIKGRDSSEPPPSSRAPPSRRTGAGTQRDRRGSVRQSDRSDRSERGDRAERRAGHGHTSVSSSPTSSTSSGSGTPWPNELIVDAIFSAHSDGLMVILRPANGGKQGQSPTESRPSTAGVRDVPSLLQPSPPPRSFTGAGLGGNGGGGNLSMSPRGASVPSLAPSMPNTNTHMHANANAGHPLSLTRESLTLPPILTREPRNMGGRPKSSHTR